MPSVIAAGSHAAQKSQSKRKLTSESGVREHVRKQLKTGLGRKGDRLTESEFDALVERMVGVVVVGQEEGADWSLEQLCGTMDDPELRVAAANICRSTMASRQRLEHIMFHQPLMPDVSESSESEDEEDDARLHAMKLPPAWQVEEVAEEIETTARRHWESGREERGQSVSLSAACLNGFPLSKKWPRFWGEVVHSLKEQQGEAFNARGANGEPILKRGAKRDSDNTYAMMVVEISYGARFTRNGRVVRKRHSLEMPNGRRIVVPKMRHEPSDSDYDKVCFGERHAPVNLSRLPVAAADITDRIEIRRYFSPLEQLRDDTETHKHLLSTLRFGALFIGVERPIIADRERWVRFLDARTLLHQWVLRHHRAIKGDGDITLEVGLQPWMDASSIGDKSTMLSLLIFRPSDMEQMDESQAHRFLRPRIQMIADDCPETRAAYNAMVPAVMTSVRSACNELKVKVGTRTITVKAHADAPIGDYHCHDGFFAVKMSGHFRCPFAFVSAVDYGDFFAFANYIRTKVEATGRGLVGAKDFLFIAQEYAKLEQVPRDQQKPVHLGGADDCWCTISSTADQSQVHGIAPFLCGDLTSTFERRGTHTPARNHRCQLLSHARALCTGFKFDTLGIDPDHCKTAVAKNLCVHRQRAAADRPSDAAQPPRCPLAAPAAHPPHPQPSPRSHSDSRSCI